jgi:hypothetical protein
MNLTLYIDPVVAKLIVTSVLAPVVVALWKRARKSNRK